MGVALSIRGLKKNFGSAEIIRGVDLDVVAGENHAIIGPNGAGKSTLLSLLSGQIQPTEGEILLGTQSIAGKSPERILRSGLARSFQVSNVFGNLSVFENIRCACFQRAHVGYQFWRAASSIQGVNEHADEIVRLIGLEAERDALAGALPYAGQRALEIGITAAGEPRVMLLDEPTAGMSNAETVHAIDLIRRITTARTLMIVEHDMGVVFQLADRISVLVYGRIIATGTPEEIRANAEVRKAYLGEEAA